MRAAREWSLGQRLLVGLLVVSFAYWAVIAWLTVRDSIDEIYEIFDVHLAQTALALLRVTDPDDLDPPMLPRSKESASLTEVFSRWQEIPKQPSAPPAASTGVADKGTTSGPVVTGSFSKNSIHLLHAEYERNLRYQIWNGAGQLLLRSANAPAAPLTDRDGYSETTDDEGRVWRYYGVWDQHRAFRILVAESHDVRNRLVRSITLHVVSPLALGMPVLILLLWYSIGRGLDPLGTLAREIQRRQPQDLMPLDSRSAPGEVRPLVRALNDLMQRMTLTLESERRFTANAAHELRTPLAAIQAQLDGVSAAANEAERGHAMEQLRRGVRRGVRLVGQLLTLARLDPGDALPEAGPVDVGDVAGMVCAELAPLALQRGQELELAVEPGLPPCPGNADMLSMLLGNLVDNAIRYTQQGGRIDIAVIRCEPGLQVKVADNGPGVPLAERERVFERFYRIAGQDQPGTGLGLAICKRIAALHHARIELSDGPGGTGLVVSVWLPLNKPETVPATTAVPQ